MPKFSELIATAAAATEAATKAEDAYHHALDAEDVAHNGVVAALKAQSPSKVALVDPAGSVEAYSLNGDGTGYVVETIGGDFEVDDAPPPPPADDHPADDQPHADVVSGEDHAVS